MRNSVQALSSSFPLEFAKGDLLPLPDRPLLFLVALWSWHPLSQPARAGAEQPWGPRGAQSPLPTQIPARVGSQGLSPSPHKTNGAAGSGFVKDPLLVLGTGFPFHNRVFPEPPSGKRVPLVSTEKLLSS